MAQATSVSLSKFTAAVQAAVKAAVAKHPKFKLDVPDAVTVSYLIRGIPVPEGILNQVSLGETQAFAAEIASHIANASPGMLDAHVGAADGAMIALGRHIIVGIPPAVQTVRIEK